METPDSQAWIGAIAATVASYRHMIDATVAQLSDAELHAHPAPGINSVAILLRHLGGNLRSRWTDFLTTDGEKPDRDRDAEFQEWEGDRAALLAHFDAGWDALSSAIKQINPSNIDQRIFIRGERHTIPQALTRSITHITYHVGQIAIVARMVHDGPWHWLTIAPGQSQQHNQRTWGTASSRSIFEDPDAKGDASS
ncbi:DinB superfamily protein [Bremerella volcania]|uniref:DinB superfamily protein n=1 Tax=Bremerella volcania TaxID=2527984 RepID=A0A518C8I5_9BACT|nr:DinB family protein [Bremerella volcania]QDU75535.1 DinB superfamily protein [Bremerella volcania]